MLGGTEALGELRVTNNHSYVKSAYIDEDWEEIQKLLMVSLKM